MRKSFTCLALLCGILSSVCSYSQTALSFNGTNAYVSTTAYVVPTSGDFTVEFWAYASVIGSNLREFVSQGSTAGGQNFYIGTESGGNIRCGDTWQNSG